jgi:hypothetical protein
MYHHNRKGSILKSTYILIVFILSLGLVMSGCSPSSGAPAKPAQSDASQPSETAIPSATLTAVPTPIKTTEPDIAPTAAPTHSQTPEPTATPAESAKPTAEPSAAPEEDSGKVTLADGFYYIKLNEEIKQRITGMSYPKDDEDIEISYDDLRYIKLKHYDFEGKAHEGELIVHKKLADEVTEIFYELYKAEYPLESVRLVDDYGEPGDDNLSMADNNTSAFNYRKVTGSKTLSRHSYGAAIDINPMLNPYIDGDRIAPENGVEYADRSKDFAGKIDHDDLCYKLFTQHGWTWGGDWKGDKDYQHFSKDIGF